MFLVQCDIEIENVCPPLSMVYRILHDRVAVDGERLWKTGHCGPGVGTDSK